MDRDWVLVDNPSYGGKAPRILKADCHDGTPCVDIRCSCGYTLHQHESRTKDLPVDAEIACSCLGCGELLVFPPGWFHEAFAQMRADGWIE